MSSEAFDFIEKVIDHIRYKCSSNSIDPSDFLFEGEATVNIIGKNYSNLINKETSISLKNKKLCDTDDYETYSKIARIESSINVSYHHSEKCKVSLIPNLRVGQKFFPVKSYNFDTNEEVFLNNNNGITVIFFLNDWNNPNIWSIFKSNLIEALERNFSKWNGKVKVYTSCQIFDEEHKKKIMKLIEENDFNKYPEIIDHMYRDLDNPADYIYDLNPYPSFVIVDGKGILKSRGPAVNSDIEDTVNEMIDKGEMFVEKIPFSEKSWTKDSLVEKDLADRFYSFIAEARNSYNNVGVVKKGIFENLFSVFTKEKERAIYCMGLRMTYDISFKYNMREGKIEDIKTHEIGFRIDCKQKEFDEFNALIQKYFSEEEAKNNEIKLELIETFDIEIPHNITCSGCQNRIEKEDLTYHCPECKIFFCAQCVNSRKNKSGFEALVHKEHYLVVFKNPNPEYLKNLEKYKLGRNLFAGMNEEELKREHSFGCNGREVCDEEVFKERLICLNCRPGRSIIRGFNDFCLNCFEQIIDANSPVALKCEDHVKNHIYLDMLFKGKSYFEY